MQQYAMNFIEKMTLDDLLDKSPGYFLWKDMNSVYLKSCIKTAKLLGFKRTHDIPGITDYTINCDAANFGKIYVQQDEYLKKKKRSLSILDLSSYGDKVLRPYLINKTIVRDNSNMPVAIACATVVIDRGALKNAVSFLLNSDSKTLSKAKKHVVNNYYLNEVYPDYNLSVRQSECLFYIIRGRSLATIASQLNLSKRTVEDTFEMLKYKMHCQNKSEVIEKAINAGFAEIIPPSVLHDNIS